MPTGMRALDLRGRITYVNAAFCQMTGWSESNWSGAPPLPLLARHRPRDRCRQMLADELAGRTKTGGVQMRVKAARRQPVRRARMYVSPLVDARGNQTGWMSSMTDITEPNRIREQLSASFERFTTVLEALDASISVAPLGSDELLFANKLYRLWFGADTGGHLRWSPRPACRRGPSDEDARPGRLLRGHAHQCAARRRNPRTPRKLQRAGLWLEVRSRYLNWVDGRLAQMVIATDISAAPPGRAAGRRAGERAQNASRLITMGEMASSVAHELNQPLTAINNYCNGMVSRIRAADLRARPAGALEKTARQAQRAGQIIQRIRSFVKRSEPNRTWSRVGDPGRRGGGTGRDRAAPAQRAPGAPGAPRLPLLQVDPILIEQVLINLLKNAAESIDAAQRPPPLRLCGAARDPTPWWTASTWSSSRCMDSGRAWRPR